MLNGSPTLVFLASFSMLSASALISAPTAVNPKLSASAIQIAMVEAGDIQIPAEFRFAMYERLVERLRTSGAFQKIYRTGDRAAEGVSDLVTLHTRVEGFKQGSQTVRELTTVLGATSVDITASITGRDGHELMNKKITGRVRFFGENLGVTDDLAKRIANFAQKGFSGGR
jgi:hypothetical protein